MSKRKTPEDYNKNMIEEASTVRKIVTIIIVALILTLIIGGIFGYNYVKSALEPVDPTSDEEIDVEIPLGASSSEIGRILEENGIVKNARIFQFYIKFKNESDFQAGEYTFSPSFTIDDTIDTLKDGQIMAEAEHAITIPEGKTIEQIAEIYANALHFSEEEFLEKVNDEDYIDELIAMYPTLLSEDILNSDIHTPLEGYLFAATYEFFEDEPTIESIVEAMLDKTVDVVKDFQTEMEELDYNIHEIITFASLLENESKNEEERRLIAGIFYNRMEEEMKLQTDPTVLYALGEHKDTVLLDDLEVDSPYNTYVVHDLPVGPISNFGVDALDSTINPEETDYMYFLHDEQGNIYYAVTHEEHEQLKQEHRP